MRGFLRIDGGGIHNCHPANCTCVTARRIQSLVVTPAPPTCSCQAASRRATSGPRGSAPKLARRNAAQPSTYPSVGPWSTAQRSPALLAGDDDGACTVLASELRLLSTPRHGRKQGARCRLGTLRGCDTGTCDYVSAHLPGLMSRLSIPRKVFIMQHPKSLKLGLAALMAGRYVCLR
jgi:hypothetical protein